MLRRLILITALLCMAGLAFAGEPGDTKPGWTGVDFSGGEIDFPAVLDGKPTILVFWASWCPYCKAFMPYLGDIQSDYGEDKMNILAVNVFEENEDDPVAFLEALRFPVIAVVGGESIAEDYSVMGTPGLFILDGQGGIAWRRESTDLPPGKTVAEYWDEQLREQLDRLL